MFIIVKTLFDLVVKVLNLEKWIVQTTPVQFFICNFLIIPTMILSNASLFIHAIFGGFKSAEPINEMIVVLTTQFSSFLYGYIINQCLFGTYTEIGVLNFLLKHGFFIGIGGLVLYYNVTHTPKNLVDIIFRSIGYGMFIPFYGFAFLGYVVYAILTGK